jgi:hypothetical protein
MATPWKRHKGLLERARISGRGWRDDHVRRYFLAHVARGLPRLGPDRRYAHCVWIRYQREQSSQSSSRRLFRLHVVVGQTESLVRHFHFHFLLFDWGANGCVWVRTWVLLLGMSGMIVLFWFLKGGEVLRYFVSWAHVPLFSALLIGAGMSFRYYSLASCRVSTSSGTS